MSTERFGLDAVVLPASQLLRIPHVVALGIHANE